MNIQVNPLCLESDHNKSCLYVDSPMPGSVKQFNSFFESGFFNASKTKILTKKRFRRGPDFSLAPYLRPVFYTEGKLPHLDLSDKTAVFYAFNSKSNISMIANRSTNHALILHGESNKISSCRPMARIYDYVFAPGKAAIDRYLGAKIFTDKDVSDGRVVCVGDTFVQTIPHIRPARETDLTSDQYIMYAPTWENTSKNENYTSATDGYGFDAAILAATAVGTKNILIKLHPNFGAINKTLIRSLINSLNKMTKMGFNPVLFDHNLNTLSAFELCIRFGQRLFNHKQDIPIALAIVDISGMEAICLKQGLKHVVLRANIAIDATPKLINDEVYPFKAVIVGETFNSLMSVITNVLQDNHGAVDELHKNEIFSYDLIDFKKLSAKQRHSRVLNHISNSKYWSR